MGTFSPGTMDTFHLELTPSLSLTVNATRCSGNATHNSQYIGGPPRPIIGRVTLPPKGSNQVVPLIMHTEMQNWPHTWYLSVSGLGSSNKCRVGETTCEVRVNLTADTPAAGADIEAASNWDDHAGFMIGVDGGPFPFAPITCRVDIVLCKAASIRR